MIFADWAPKQLIGLMASAQIGTSTAVGAEFVVHVNCVLVCACRPIKAKKVAAREMHER